MTDNRTDERGKESARNIVIQLRNAGFTALFAGGCVRDMLLGRTPRDYDVATSAIPEDVRRLFPDAIEIGAAFGVMQVVRDGIATQVATFRADVGTDDGRHPASIRYANPEEDARRRDFTINGMFYDPVSETVLDYVGGRKDLEAKLIRAIGEPAERFAEDYLRLLRAVRFASTLDFRIETRTADAIRAAAHHIAAISAERIQHELTILLTESPRAGQGLRLLLDMGILDVILHEVVALAGQEQPPEFHPEGDVFTHTANMLDSMRTPSATLAYAVLLHDVGKPSTAERVHTEDGAERLRFHGHAAKGAEIAESIMRRLHMPLKEIEAVSHCIADHMRFMDVQRMRPATLRRMVGAPTFETELELHRLDCLGSHGDLDNYHFLVRYVKELANQPALPPPWITGRDILALGIPEGPDIGRWHRAAYEAQLEGRFSARDDLLAWVREQVSQDQR